MTQYLMSVWMVEGEPAPSPEAMEKAYKDVDAFNQEIMAAGQWVFGGGLHPADTATVVKATGGDVITTDGPFAETKEQLGGYYLVDCKDLDEAIEASARMPVGPHGTVEIRPVAIYDEEGRPSM